MIDRKYKQEIKSEIYVSGRILQVAMSTKHEKFNFISVYAPDITRKSEEKEKFYEELQAIVDKIIAQEEIVIMGDLNARIANEQLNGVTQKFNEETINEHN